jgi:hypothetical protein
VGLRADLNGYGIFRHYRGLDPGPSSQQRIAIPTTQSRPYGEGSIGIATNTISENVNTRPKFLMIRRDGKGGSGNIVRVGGIATSLLS